MSNATTPWGQTTGSAPGGAFVPEPTRPDLTPSRPVYDGTLGELYAIYLRHLVLMLVTLGWSRFWGRTRIRRYVWNHLSILGDRFEYRGRGRELLIGFLLAVVLSALGLDLPLATAWGHSVSAALREPLDAPQSAVFDVRHHVSITRLGQRVRVAGGADLSPTDRGDARDTVKRLYQVLMDWFPGAARLGGAQGSVQQWRGAMVMTPDDLPVVGQSRVPGVWFNLGHGPAGIAAA